ncbi:MAG: bifunctional aspartate transaminase/aspartate 4-decarboxylase [Bacteroidaceae bacterium]|nr:bifunctional aspartate transaminase/aspartate 4-decarboxylase [Bacteroidaceae bacterium]
MEYLRNKSEVGKDFEQQMSKISPFELKNRLISMADESVRKMAHTMLNAGRGNPNWIATTPREAFFLLGKFGLEECRRTFDLPEGFAGLPQKPGIAQRFEEFLKKHANEAGATMLSDAYNYMLMEHAADPDELVHEWTESVIGDQYPVPDRILKYTEVAVRDYLNHELCDNRPPEGVMQLFAVEGGTAAMCYIFDSLMQNYLLHTGDSIALLVPAFTPYIEIPELKHYDFDVLHIPASRMTDDGLHLWQYDEKDINKLRDPKYKALFIINPSNPPSYALAPETVAQIKDIVDRWNPNLMIVTDDVYATYIPHFRSVLADLPRNTIGVYSFSKYFGATGWRAAVLAIYEDNIFDQLLHNLPRKRKAELAKRYGSLTMKPEEMKFIDRMVADSRQVGLNHTAGLSLPQQMQMSLFALFSLMDKENKYRTRMLDIIQRRLQALWDSTGFTLVPDPLRAGYYSEIDMLVWAKKFYGEEFVDFLKKNYNPLDVVFRLATETGLVVLNGGGFDGPEWSVRVSLANLNEIDYVRIGKSIRQILTEYADAWKGNTCC